MHHAAASIQKLTRSKISNVAHQLNHAAQKQLLRQPAIQKIGVDIPPFWEPPIGQFSFSVVGLSEGNSDIGHTCQSPKLGMLLGWQIQI